MATESVDLQYLIDLLIPQMQATRQRRLSIENEWLMNYRAWQGWPSMQYQLPLPDNAIHYFIPWARRAVERNVVRCAEMLMPNKDWHQTLPFDNQSHENAENVHQVMSYLNEHYLNTDMNINTAERCLQLYDFTCLHTSVMVYDKDVWPYQEVVDPFSFYVFPETCHDATRAQLIFKDFIVPYQIYAAYVNKQDEKKSIYKAIKVDDLQGVSWPYHLVERLAYRGLTSPSDWQNGTGNVRRMNEVELREKLDENRQRARSELSKQADAFVELSHVYFRLDSRWFYTVLCRNLKSQVASTKNAQVVRLDQEEMTPRYRWANARTLPGELYTNSKMDDIRTLQNLANNAISDVEANRQQVQANPLAIDSTAAGRISEYVFGSRKFWLTPGNPNDIIKSIDVEDVSTNGIRAWQIYLSLIDKHSGGTLAEGQPGRNMPRAGFATQDLLNMSLVEIKDDAKILERRVFGPGLGDVYHTLLEYVPNSQLIRIPNVDAGRIKQFKKSDLVGDYQFIWLGNMGSQNEAERADKFMQLAQMWMNPNVYQALSAQLAQEGLKFDLIYFFKMMYSYGLGERGLKQLIIPMSEQEKAKLNQPSPEQQQAQQEMQMKQAEQQQNMQMAQQDHQMKLQQVQQKGQVDIAVARQKAQVDMQKMQGQMQLNQQEQQGKLIDMQVKRAEMAMNMLRPVGESQGSESNQNKRSSRQRK